MKPTLTEIANQYGTDKGAYHTFTEFYAEHFNDIREDVTSVLEIGILYGASIQMWHDYFENAKIYGIDIPVYKNTELNFKFHHERINAYKCSCEDIAKFKELFSDIKFDIICDDGSHTIKHQLQSFANYFEYVKPGGYYIIEDIHTSFNPAFLKQENQHVEDLRSSIDVTEKVTTYDVLYKAQQTNKIMQHKYLNDEQRDYIQTNLESVTIYQKDETDPSDSVTCIIKKLK